MSIRALIVEDEPLARRTLLDFAQRESDVDIIAEASNGRDAVRLIDELRPDLLFLDVQIPELSGLEVLERIEHDPEIIFTTAFDRYAVSAFELEALDYLLKPFGQERFQTALEKARQRLLHPSHLPPVRERAHAALDVERSLTRIFVRHRGQIVPVKMDEVVRIEAADDYVEIHAHNEVYLVQLTLSELAARLDAVHFRRVHRSHLINLNHLSSMQPYDERRLLLVMADGSKVLASRGGTQELRGLIA
jgi:two-component system LytT family response regulator